MSGGWTVVDAINNKSLPIQGTSTSGANVPYVAPSPGNQDAVGKLRTSTPQALIDTDFEYGTQPTKWESISLQANRQSVYYIPQATLNVTSLTGSGSADGQFTLRLQQNLLVAADPIFVQNSNDQYANGWGHVLSVSGSGPYDYVVQAGGGMSPGIAVSTFNTIPASNLFNSALTAVFKGFYYSQSGFDLTGTTALTYSGNLISVTTTFSHGLNSGSLIYVRGLTASTNPPNGAWQVYDVQTPTTFRYYAVSTPTGTIGNTAGRTNIFARPAGYVEPRTFDGGVAFTAGGGVPNQQLIRQTRRYFRYQSGKSIQFSTGTSLKPALFVTSMTSSGTTITVTTRFAHNLSATSRIQVIGAEQGQYNGLYTVTSVTSPSTFTYVVTSAPVVTTATGFYRVSPYSWYGAANRIGLFDSQNGFFFEYDGQTLYAVLRNSVNQINGTVEVTNGSASVTGTGTQFASQLAPNDNIVIRGQTYRVVSIGSNTSMTITPEYRGTTIASPASCLISKTVEVRIPQSVWSDPLNGTGPSGYNLDLTRMQMWFIDYSWYGAGVVRYGIRTTNGVINYVTQIVNNNRQFEAYMRSGNMCARYESTSDGPFTIMTASLAAGTTTSMSLLDTSLFPSSGTVKLQDATYTEYISYTGNTNNKLTGLTRGLAGGGSAQSYIYSSVQPIGIELVTPDTTPSLSHWGSSVIMDGQFNDDKSLIFNYGTPLKLQTTISTTQVTPVMAIRTAPSVSNGQVGLFGAQEIINRMQLQLFELGIYATGPLLVNLILNGYTTGTFSGAFQSPVTPGVGATTSSLAQVATNVTNTVTVTGGESVAAAFTNTNGQTTLDLTQVRDLGNSILGGGTSLVIPASQAGFYPDGPDILYVCVTPLTATAIDVYARLSWREAQA